MTLYNIWGHLMGSWLPDWEPLQGFYLNSFSVPPQKELYSHSCIKLDIEQYNIGKNPNKYRT